MRKCIYLSYYFPPSGGSGVQRALKLSKYLPLHGWAPTVVTVDPEQAAYPSLDKSLAADVPRDLHVVCTPAWDPYAAYAKLLGSKKDSVVSIGFSGEGQPSLKQRVARFARANFFVPDARVGWVPSARRALTRLAESGEYEAVITTGPPHSTHLAARKESHRHGIPWIADLRDPWTEIYFYKDLPALPPARAIDRWLEKKVYSNADALIVVSKSMETRLRERGISTPIHYLPNGYDAADFDSPAPVVDPWMLRHVGNLGPSQSAAALAQALALTDLEAAPYTVSFVGSTDPLVLEPFRAGDMEARIDVRGVVPHDNAVDRMREAGLLFLVIPRFEGADAIVTGKLYEYLATGRPILGIGPPSGDAAAILADADAGTMYHWDDSEGIRRFLEDHATHVVEGQAAGSSSPETVLQYERSRQAGELSHILQTVVEGRAGR